MGWAGNVARVGDSRGAYRVLVGRPDGKTEREHLEDSGVDGRIILKRIFRKWKGEMGTLIWFMIETGGELL